MTWRVLLVLVLLFVFLVGIKGMGGGFKLFGKDILHSFFQATDNPFLGLVIGILATTLVQSSSVTTSMIVALVAAPDNPLPVQHAVPMIMGANIGTTVTNTIVALGHITRRDEFRRAFAVATCHDFFNYLTVVVLLPLELLTGMLSRMASVVAHAVVSGGATGGELGNPLKTLIKAVLGPIKAAVLGMTDSHGWQAVILISISGVLILGALTGIVKLMRTVALTRFASFAGGRGRRRPMAAMLVGLVLTVIVQSSSMTTAVLVPLAGAGLLTLAQAFPFTLGANVGTTVTALLASAAVSGGNAVFGVQIALVHLFFNLLGILFVYPIPAVRQIPLRAAEWLAAVATRSRKWALIYVVGMFYGLPALLVFISQLAG